MDFITKLKQQHYRSVLLLGLILISLPFSFSLNSICTALLLLNELNGIGKNRVLSKNPLSILLFGIILYFLLHLISLVYTTDLNEGWFKIQTMLSLLIIPMIYLKRLPLLSKRELNTLLKAFVLGAFIAITTCFVIGAYKAFFNGQTFMLRGSYLSSPIMHRGYLALYLGLSIFITFSHEKLFKAYTIPLVIFFTVSIVMLQGRINVLSLLTLGSGFLLWDTFKKFNLKKILTRGLLLVFLLGTFFMLPDRISRLSSIKRNIPFLTQEEQNAPKKDARNLIWANALNAIKKNLPLGAGIGDSKSALAKEYTLSNYELGKKRIYNCHNQYLEATLSTGILGLATLLFIWAYTLFTAYKIKSTPLVLFSLYFSFCMLTESLLLRYWGIMAFSAVFPLFFYSEMNQSKQEQNP